MKKTLTFLSAVICLNANAQVCFNTATNYVAGATQPLSVCYADFNNDGKLDLATSNDNSNKVSVFLGTGTGSFGAATVFSVGTAPRSIISADFNGDGKADLAVANGLSNNISVLLGTGTGSFGTATNFAAANYPSSVCSGDFNADGKLDLAVSNVSSNNVSILLGTGTGSFGTAVNFGCGGSQPNSVISADFNGDSKLDLAIANDNSANVSVLLGTGTGSFGTATTFALGTNPTSVSTSDFNGDGKVDLVTGNQSNGVYVLLGTGTGSFGSPANFSTINGQFVITGDFNTDGNVDIAAVGGSISVVLGDGAGSFGMATDFTAGTGTNGICSADFNGDGKPDLATANYTSNDMSVLLNCNTSSVQTICYPTPSGIDNTWTGGWSYKEYIIPSGYKIDSVNMGATRPGYPASQEDFIFHYCAGTTIYNSGTATQPFNYQTDNNSEYNHWINLTSFNYSSVGVVRVFLPVNAGAVWNNLCIAISPFCTGITASITANGPITFCQGGNVILTATTATSYLWSNNATTQSITVGTAGANTVTTINSNGCSATSATTTVTVNSKPTVVTTDPSAVCAPSTVDITLPAITTGSTGGLTYTYFTDAGATTPYLTPTATTTGTYYLVGATSNSCSDTTAVTVTVNPLPTVAINTIPNFININAAPIALTGTPTGGTFSGNGVSSNSFTPSIAGLGTSHITYNYTDNNTCSNSSVTSTIVYDTTGTLCTSYDTVYTSVTDTLVINAVLTGVLPPNNINAVTIYPNPASTHITIDNGNYNLMTGYTLKIENNLGQTVFTSLINQQQFYINLSTWSGNGIYFVHIIDAQSNTIEIKKIVLQ